jgi:hypothetical protein
VFNSSTKAKQVGAGTSSIQIGIVVGNFDAPDQDGKGNGKGKGKGTGYVKKRLTPEMRDNPPNVPEYIPPKGGAKWVKNPNGTDKGWLDKKGYIRL